MNKLHIVHAEEKDLEGVLNLYQHYNHPIPPLPNCKTTLNHWNEILENKNILFFIGKSNGKIVASCFLMIIPQMARQGMPYGLIENVITHPDYRKSGYASQLLQHSIQAAWKHNCFQVMLLTGNKETHKFYTKNGFTKDRKTGFIIYKGK
ncbi:MAG TPA: GNAT family N-acetyltransferase [Victivallales bacterium]|nr:GNAT family N-acetyltransferase [Victivallales bacterium]